MNGSIDEIIVYNRALTTAEIQNLYQSNLAKYDMNKRTFSYNASGLTNNPGHFYIFT